MAGLIGRKIGMTRVFSDDGAAVPVTVVEAGPCPVLQVRASSELDASQRAVQLGFGRKKANRSTKAELGHAARAGLDYAPRVIREFRIAGDAELAAGENVTVSLFASGDVVKVVGQSKGRGFQGIVHRYGAGGGPASHGNTRHRKPGSVGAGTDPSRVIKGKRMPGHMGARRHTEMGLTVVRIDADNNLLFVRGAIPGAKNGIVTVAKQGGGSRHA